MSTTYKITGPLHVNNRKPGDLVDRDELSDPDFLESIGYIAPVAKGSAKKLESDRAGLVESTTDSTTESEPVSSQEKL